MYYDTDSERGGYRRQGPGKRSRVQRSGLSIGRSVSWLGVRRTGYPYQPTREAARMAGTYDSRIPEKTKLQRNRTQSPVNGQRSFGPSPIHGRPSGTVPHCEFVRVPLAVR